MEKCPFCDIANKKAKASMVYEDKDHIAFMDIRPINVGHTLVAPKKHYRDLLEMPEKEVAELFKIVLKVSQKVKKLARADGVQLSQTNGKAAGQDVFHIHVHVIPRFSKDRIMNEFVTMMKPLIVKPTREELEGVAKKLRDLP